MSITSLLRRAGAVLNPPPHPWDTGPMPQLRDYPVARRPANQGRPRR